MNVYEILAELHRLDPERWYRQWANFGKAFQHVAFLGNQWLELSELAVKCDETLTLKPSSVGHILIWLDGMGLRPALIPTKNWCWMAIRTHADNSPTESWAGSDKDCMAVALLSLVLALYEAGLIEEKQEMNEPKFTPGPWEIHELLDHNDNPTIAVRDQDDETIYMLDFAGPNDRCNAHLIAAAPEMYAMLEEILPHIDEWNFPVTMRTNLERLLAKARGEL